MKTIARTKLNLKGNKQWVELRSYEIEKPIAYKKSVRVVACQSKEPRECFHTNEEYMTLTWRQLKKGKVLNTQKSQFPPFSTYLMLEYEFIPDITDEAIHVSNVMQGMAQFRDRPEYEALRAKLHSK